MTPASAPFLVPAPRKLLETTAIDRRPDASERELWGAVESGRELQPLAYHRRIVDYLAANEPHVWAWARSADVRDQWDEARAAMLKQTYRLEEGSHPAVFGPPGPPWPRWESMPR